MMENDKKLYIATFEFISGEYGQIFYKTFYADSENDLENKIHKYLIDYYGEGNISNVDNDIYYYWNSEVAVEVHGWEEITNLHHIADKLSI